ncbi:MAG: M23 family metallopeptidase [Weeksellaceae bacterium]
MKKYLLVFFFLLSYIALAEIRVKIYFEQVTNGYNIYADNYEFCPVSVKINFNLLNLNVYGGNNNIYVVNTNSRRQLLTTLRVNDYTKRYWFSYVYHTNLGNHYDDYYDWKYAYDLPYSPSSQHKVSQGYNGSFSHQNRYALDFEMPIGTKILAARDGTVIRAVNQFNYGCAHPDCAKYNNYILIYHSDGTFGNYSHLSYNGVMVREGQNVLRGQLMGYSGNTGFSSGPHLHFEVYKQKLFNRYTLQTRFRTGDGNTYNYLQERQVYPRNY